MNVYLNTVFFPYDAMHIAQERARGEAVIHERKEKILAQKNKEYTDKTSFDSTFGVLNELFCTLTNIKSVGNTYLLIQGSLDQGSVDQGSVDQGSSDQGSVDQKSTDQKSPSLKVLIQESLEALGKQYLEEISMNEELYHILKKVYHALKEKKVLTPLEEQYAKHIIEGFEKNGVHLKGEERKKFIQLSQQAYAAEISFEQELQNDTRAVIVPMAEVTGVSEEKKKILAVDNQGNYVLPPDYATTHCILDYSTNRSLREKVYRQFIQRGYPKNLENIARLRSCHKERAALLNYPTFAACFLHDQMAKEEKTVEEFLSLLAAATKETAESEAMAIRHFAKEVLGIDPIEGYDVAFIIEQYQRKNFHFDEEEFSHYFCSKKTIERLLLFFERFLGISCTRFDKESLGTWAWHESLEVVEVKKEGVVRGYVIIDLYPRPGKYTHGCMTQTIHSYLNSNGVAEQLPVITLVMNLTPPAGAVEAFFSYDDLFTLFHEMGHALHGVLGVLPFAELSGVTGCTIDFVEVPSQFFQLFALNKEILQFVSSHGTTGDPIPDAMVKALIAAKSFGRAYTMQRYIAQSRLSLFVYQDDAAIEEIKKRSRQGIVTLASVDPEDHSECAFGHLTEYYAAYYSYAWAMAYSRMLYHYCMEHGGFLSEKNQGKEFLHSVLEKGGAGEHEDLIKHFLGVTEISMAQRASNALF